MHRDPAAFKLVLRVTPYLLIWVSPLLEWLLLRGTLVDPDGTAYPLLAFALSVCALQIPLLLLVTIWNWKDAWLIRREGAQTVNVIVRDQLRTEAFFVATLLERSSSEQMLLTKTLPPGIEVITRSSHLDRFRSLNLLDALPEDVRNLFLLPDGHWTPNQIDTSWHSVEALRCLRWVLCVDGTLPSLGDVIAANGKDLQSLLAKPERLLKAERLLDPWDIRVERNIADAVFSRCYVEQLSRGHVPPVDEEQKKLAMDLHEAALASPHEDYLVGIHTLVELSDEDARNLWMIAYRRHSCLCKVMDLLEGGSIDDLRKTIYMEYE